MKTSYEDSDTDSGKPSPSSNQSTLSSSAALIGPIGSSHKDSCAKSGNQRVVESEYESECSSPSIPRLLEGYHYYHNYTAAPPPLSRIIEEQFKGLSLCNSYPLGSLWPSYNTHSHDVNEGEPSVMNLSASSNTRSKKLSREKTESPLRRRRERKPRSLH